MTRLLTQEPPCPAAVADVPIILKITQSNAGGQPLAPSVLDLTVPRSDIYVWHGWIGLESVMENTVLEALNYRHGNLDETNGGWVGNRHNGGEVELAVRLKDHHGWPEVAVFTTWQGATGWASWLPASSAGKMSTAVDFARQGIAALAKVGRRGFVHSVVYTGGEADTTVSLDSSEYGTRVLPQYAARIRQEFGADVRFIIDSLKDSDPTPHLADYNATNIALIRAGEAAYAATDPLCTVVDNDDLYYLGTSVTPNDWKHIDADGQATKGVRDADTVNTLGTWAPTTTTHMRCRTYDTLARAQHEAYRQGLAQGQGPSDIRIAPVDTLWAVEHLDDQWLFQVPKDAWDLV